MYKTLFSCRRSCRHQDGKNQQEEYEVVRGAESLATSCEGRPGLWTCGGRVSSRRAFIHLLPRAKKDERWAVCPFTWVSTRPFVHDGFLTPCCVCVSAERAESPGPSERSAAPVTRSRRRVVKDASVAPHVSASAYELHAFTVEVAGFAFSVWTYLVCRSVLWTCHPNV